MAVRSRFGVATLCLAAIAGGYFGGRPLLERVEFERAEAQVQATRQQLNTVEDLSTVFRHVGKVVEPSVVEIQVTKTIHTDNDAGNMFRRFFQDGGPDSPNMPGMPNMPDNGGEETEIGTGSGVIMEASNGYGYILTNNHVAGDTDNMQVTLADGRLIKHAKLIGADAKSDLAVVQIKADRLIPAKWGNSDELEKGDWVLAFGAPFGFVGSMTHGIVSALNRTDVMIEGKNGYANFIQVDAPINPGNSGGPLVNIHGEVVGINTAIATRSGGFQGIGFAIPINQAQRVYNQLREHGKVTRGWLGVSIGDVSKNLGTAHYFGYTGDSGVLVEQTFPGTPASGKLQEHDIITKYQDQDVDDVQQLRNLVAATAPNTRVKIGIFRNGHEETIELTIGTQPENLDTFAEGGAGGNGNGQAESPTKALGMQFSTLDKDTADRLGVGQLNGGAVITSVDHNSIAEQAGLMQGDVILKVGNTPVNTAEDAANALQHVDLKKGVPLYVASKEGSRFVFLQQDGDSGQ